MKSYWFLIISVLLALDLAIVCSLVRVGDGMEVHVLDVGQGDSVLVRSSEGHNILVDGGPGRDVILELAEVVPYLFSEIDLLVMTHPHADHIEGLIPVLDRFEVGAVLLSAPEYGSLAYEEFLGRIEGMEVYIADDGMDFRFGDLEIDILYPFEPILGVEMENVNNASPVMMISDGRQRVLLSGDAEIEVEMEVIEAVLERGLDVSADILKAGHHGSKTASAFEFLEAVGTRVLAISVGAGNSFGHPHEETLEKADDLGIEVLRTDLEGRLSFYFCAEGAEFFLQSFIAAIYVNHICDGCLTVCDEGG
jgi:competence protein ComEC